MANVVDEVLQNFLAARRMSDFGVKLQTVKFPLRIFDRGEITSLRARGGPKTFRQCGYFITVTVPDIELRAEPVEKLRTVCDLQHTRAVLTASAEYDLTAEMMRHLHEAVANSEDGNAERENLGIDLRRAFLVNAGWTAGENDSVRRKIDNFRCGNVEGNNLGVDLQFANAARDHLGVLRAEVEDEDS